MKKNPLVEKIARSATIDEVAAKRAVNIILTGIVEGLRQNGHVELGDFGAFRLLSNSSTSNQNDLQEIQKNPLRFIPSSKLRTAINKPE